MPTGGSKFDKPVKNNGWMGEGSSSASIPSAKPKAEPLSAKLPVRALPIAGGKTEPAKKGHARNDSSESLTQYQKAMNQSRTQISKPAAGMRAQPIPRTLSPVIMDDLDEDDSFFGEKPAVSASAAAIAAAPAPAQSQVVEASMQLPEGQVARALLPGSLDEDAPASLVVLDEQPLASLNSLNLDSPRSAVGVQIPAAQLPTQRAKQQEPLKPQDADRSSILMGMSLGLPLQQAAPVHLATPFIPQQQIPPGIPGVQLDPFVLLQSENQRLKATLDLMQSTLVRLEERLEDVEPFTPKQKEQLNTINTYPKLHLFFNQLLAGLNSNTLACLGLGSERLAYSSNTNDCIEAGAAIGSIAPGAGLVTGPLKFVQLKRMNHKSKGFGAIGQNYFLSINSMEIASARFAIELTTRHIEHIQHMTAKGIKSFAEFINEKLLLPAWKDKKLTSGRLHLLPSERAAMVQEWLHYVYNSKVLSKSSIELMKGLPFEWTAEDLLFRSAVQVNDKTYGNESRNASKFKVRKGTAAEIETLKLQEIDLSQQSPASDSRLERKENRDERKDGGAKPAKARTNSSFFLPQSAMNSVTLFNAPQTKAPATGHKRSQSRSFGVADKEQLKEKPAGAKPSQLDGASNSSRNKSSAAGHVRARSIRFNPNEMLQFKAKSEGVKSESLPSGSNSARGKIATPGHARNRSKLFTPAETNQVKDTAKGIKGHHRRTSTMRFSTAPSIR